MIFDCKVIDFPYWITRIDQRMVETGSGEGFTVSNGVRWCRLALVAEQVSVHVSPRSFRVQYLRLVNAVGEQGVVEHLLGFFLVAVSLV